MVAQYYLERRYARGAAGTLTTRQLRTLATAQLERATAQVRDDRRRGRRPSVEPVVRAVNVHKRFGALEVLRGIDLTVSPGR